MKTFFTILILVAIGVGAYFLVMDRDSNPDTTNEQETTTTSGGINASTDAIKDAVN